LGDLAILIKTMGEIGLIIDEGADLPREIIGKHQIAVVPLKINWPEVEKLPGKNIFQKMRAAEKRGIKSFTKTSQPSPKDFLGIFKRELEKFEKILCVTITSKLSGTYNSAIQAKNFLGEEDSKRVFVLDSLNGSAGKALLVLKAIDFLREGRAKIEEIIMALEKLIPKIHLIGMLEDPKWLEASGRISHLLANWVRQMSKLGVRPLLGVKKGIITAIGIRTGVKDVPSALFKEFDLKTKKIRKLGKKIRIVITHGDCPSEAQKLKEMLQKEFQNIEITFLNLIDNVIGSLVGPGTLVCAWCEI